MLSGSGISIKIRPFSADDCEDTVCPLPPVPKPDSSQGTPNPENGTPPPKRRRLCGIRKHEGHDKRSCPEKDTAFT